MPTNDLSIQGETRDLSTTGISFVVPSIRLREYYLVGDDHTLRAELQLPNGKIKVFLKGQRYEQVGKHISTAQYLVGASILKISAGDKEIYKEFLHDKKHNVGSLELEVGKS